MIGGIIFVLFGIGVLIFSKKKKQKIGSIIPIIIGSWVIYIYTIGPLSESDKKLDEIINIKSEEVIAINVKPTKINGLENSSIVKGVVEINDRNTIDKICEILSNSKEVHGSYIKNADWKAQLELIKKNGSITVGVEISNKRTEIEVYSKGETGWNYGSLKCDDLGTVLLDIKNENGY